MEIQRTPCQMAGIYMLCHVYGKDIVLGFKPRIADYPANRLVLIYFILFYLIGNAVTNAVILTVRTPREWA